MSPETCVYHGQFDNEIKQLVADNAEMKADIRNLTYAIGRIEKALDCVNTKLADLEKSQSDQRVTDAAQSHKINTLWGFLIDRNGLIIIGILAYVVLGRVM
jgi:septal ring factor EnvC (AmiA/AmiB activator)